MEIVKMEKRHIPEVERLAKIFYYGDAVCHEIPWENIKRTIDEAVSDSDILDGYVFEADGEAAGFGYITKYYESECGGICVQIIDLYVDDKYRRQGFARQYFDFVFDKYSYARRFRLEAVRENTAAVRLYESLGFSELGYMQMIKE